MYEKQNFLPGQKLKAEQLNHMEEGIAAAHEQSGAGVTIDLLWQNMTDTIEAGEVSVPDLGDYDFIEIVHRSNDTNEATTRIPTDGYAEGYLSFCSAGGVVVVQSRSFSISKDDGSIYFGSGNFWRMYPEEAAESGEDEYSCVPFRIYGIKGVNKSIVEGKFTIDGEEYSFVKGWNWSRWCESQYNTIGLYSSGDYIKGDSGNSTLGLVGVGEVDGRDLIVDGGKYELL